MNLFIKVKNYLINPDNVVEVFPIEVEKGGKIFKFKLETVNGIKTYSFKDRELVEEVYKKFKSYKTNIIILKENIH